MINYREINWEVMCDTKYRYEEEDELVAAVKDSVRRQYMVAQEAKSVDLHGVIDLSHSLRVSVCG